jgi:hypothetical protein
MMEQKKIAELANELRTMFMLKPPSPENLEDWVVLTRNTLDLLEAMVPVTYYEDGDDYSTESVDEILDNYSMGDVVQVQRMAAISPVWFYLPHSEDHSDPIEFNTFEEAENYATEAEKNTKE